MKKILAALTIAGSASGPGPFVEIVYNGLKPGKK